MAKIENLPDFAVIKGIAKALWGEAEVRGAALMIGAGFSRFAKLPTIDSPLPPLWADFSRAMATEIYPFEEASRLPNPLRLAEEYRAFRGEGALDSLVRELVKDDHWEPAELHKSLLQLPWSDILTTNWDTLLERTIDPDRDHTYETVLTPRDIARTRAPRIVKLHGSFPSLDPYVFTEEDFRKYPIERAPFVNLAQQVLLENELCLLGFSGDDPNFLAWSGWVRDHLGDNARKIHLIGLFEMSPSQRQLLEQRNISVIDLSPLVQEVDFDRKHRAATKIFLEFLHSAKPKPRWEWAHTEKTEGKEFHAEKLIAAWAKERDSYPGWLVAPYRERLLLRRSTTDQIRGIINYLATDDASLESKERLVVELLWRIRKAYLPVANQLEEALQKFLHQNGAGIARSSRFALLSAMLTVSRRRGENEQFDSIAFEMLELAQTDDERSEVEYERCLWGLSRLNYELAHARLPEIAGEDPKWQLRRAKIAAGLGLYDHAKSTIVSCYDDLRRQRLKDRSSVWLLSRLSVAHMALRNFWYDDPDGSIHSPFEKWPPEYALAECDPWEELRLIEHDIGEKERKGGYNGATIRPLFDPGTRTIHDPGRTQYASWVSHEHHELRSYIEQSGLFEIQHVSLFSDILARAVKLLPPNETQTVWAHVDSIRSHEGFIEEQFNRIAIANLDIAVVNELVENLKLAIEYGSARLWEQSSKLNGQRTSTVWVNRVRWQLELLSRLSIRLPSDANLALCQWALEIGKGSDFDHWWLFKPLQHLITRTFHTLPNGLKATLAGQALAFPLPSERNTTGPEHDWPDISELVFPAAQLVVRQDGEWVSRIAQLLHVMETAEGWDQAHSALRFLLLVRTQTLTESEQQQLSKTVEKLIASRSGLPKNPYLLPTVWLELCGDGCEEAVNYFTQEVIQPLAEGALTHTFVSSVNFLKSPYFMGNPVSLPENQLQKTAAAIINWKPNFKEDDLRVGDESRLAFECSRMMVSVILPNIGDNHLSKMIAEPLLDAIRTESFPHLIIALPKLAQRNELYRDEGVRLIRRFVVDSNFDLSHSALSAIGEWAALADETSPVPSILVSDITNICGTRTGETLHLALSLCRKLVIQNALSESDLDRAEHALSLLIVDTAYDSQSDKRINAVTLTLVRKECVRLAHSILGVRPDSQAALEWVKIAETDPLPEVRLAMENLELEDSRA